MMKDNQELTKTVDSIIAKMTQLEIADQEGAEVAAEFLKKNKDTQKIVKDHYEEDRKATYEAYKAVTDTIKFFIDKLTKAERTVKKKMSDYHMEQERKRREEERRLAEIARKEEEERRLAEAVETDNEELLNEPIEFPTVKVEAPKKQEGISYVDNWQFEITDVNKIPREYMLPNEKAIRQVVKSLKSNANIPGVRIYNEKSVRVS